ncbi:MAG: EAL domain-containing protein [Armatimonadetes bacterium]|nr:EAL domain-containing protein [Armatimonadota bacterium]
MRRWTETAVEIPDMRVHVNVSERQFFQSDFVEAVDAALRETGLPPWRLCLEITENVYLENVDAALTHLRRLKRLGVRLVTDDFGTGFSSLSLLRRFPLYGIKLD